VPERLEKILGILKERGPMTTRELEATLMDEGEECPDGVARVLMQLKSKGLVEGRLDKSRGTWIWSAK